MVCIQIKNCDISTVTIYSLGQIGVKQAGATEAYSLYAARSDSVAEAQDGLKYKQLHPPHSSVG